MLLKLSFPIFRKLIKQNSDPLPPNNGQVHLHYHESLESYLRGWLAPEQVNSFSSINTWHQAMYLKPKAALSPKEILDPQEPILRSWDACVDLSTLDNRTSMPGPSQHHL